jgi:hypothetical protein
VPIKIPRFECRRREWCRRRRCGTFVGRVVTAILSAAIENFLLTTTKWSVQWFHKPKFHLLVHFPQHVCQFGPAILFATESFESFNTVIHEKSIHSNQMAPSCNIAHKFSQISRICHILSGGYFLKRTLHLINYTSLKHSHRAGVGPLSLMTTPNVILKSLGVQFSNKSFGKNHLLNTVVNINTIL